MYRWILTAVLAAALLGCDSSTITVQDAQTDSPVALPDRVTGTVQLESGAPVPNAPVMLRSVADDTLVATGTTDEQGRYSLNTNGQRSYYVSVQARFAEGTEATDGGGGSGTPDSRSCRYWAWALVQTEARKAWW